MNGLLEEHFEIRFDPNAETSYVRELIGIRFENVNADKIAMSVLDAILDHDLRFGPGTYSGWNIDLAIGAFVSAELRQVLLSMSSSEFGEIRTAILNALQRLNT